MTDKDVMIGISFPRYSTMAVDAMNYARSQGAHAIAITDSMVSPLVKSADSVLIARSDMASIVDSLVAPLSLINALIVATVLKRKTKYPKTSADLKPYGTEREFTQAERRTRKNDGSGKEEWKVKGSCGRRRCGGSYGCIGSGNVRRKRNINRKNKRVGRKIMITGKGRCNVCNNCDVETL